MPVRKVEKTVYYSPAANRHYMTKRGCANGEANARMRAAFPSEQPEYEEYGRMTYPGFHWREDERLIRIAKYLAKRFMRVLRG